MLTSRARSTSLLPIALTMAVLAFGPTMFARQQLYALCIGLIYGIAVVGIDIFSGYAGKLTFGNFALMAIGAYTSAVLSTDYGWNVWLTLPASIAVTALVGYVLSFAAVKISDFGTALITFFFAYVVHQLLLGRTLAPVTHSSDGIAVATATLGDFSLTDEHVLYYVSLASLALVCLVSWRYANSESGVALRVIKRSSAVAAANGITVDRHRRIALAYSAAAAGFAGFLYAQATSYLSPEGFTTLSSVNLMAMAVLGGLGSVIGPVYGAIFYALVTESSRGTATWIGMVFPTVLLIALIAFPEGIYGFGERLSAKIGLGRVLRRRGRARKLRLDRADDAAYSGRVSRDRTTGDSVLKINDVSVHFGGVAALSNVSMTVFPGQIHAVMGPNGAGKTTLLNCVSGIQPHRGEISMRGHRVSGLPSRKIRHAGIARTFQHPSLVSDLSVIENVTAGSLVSVPRWSLGGLIPGRGTSRAGHTAKKRAIAALNLLEFHQDRWEAMASELSLAEQKIVDAARALAGAPDLVLLDEPTAGLDNDEMGVIAGALQKARDAGVTIVVIAHHVDFLRRIADEITVLDFGRVIASGTPQDVLSQREVIDIYLGAEHVG
jgi:branched-chain amino acid transport system permease protein